MLGMEMMVAKMTGLSPEQMQQKVKEFEQFVRGGSEALVAIADAQAKILAQQTEILAGLEALKNGGTN